MSRNLAIAALAILVCILAVPLGAKTTGRGEPRAPKATPRTAVSVDSRTPNPESRSLAVDRVAALKSGVSRDVLDLALDAVSCGVASGDLQAPPTLTIIDYSLPS